MVRRSSLIFAASLAVLATLEPTLGFAAAAPAQQHDGVERPRFLRREIKRQFLNVSTSLGPGEVRGPFGGQSSSESLSSLNSLTDTLTTNSPEITEASTPAPVVPPSLLDAQSLQSEISQSVNAQLSSELQKSPLTATPPTTSTPASASSTSPNTSGGPSEPTATSLPAPSPSAGSNTETVETQATSPALNTEKGATTALTPPTSSQSPPAQPPTTQPSENGPTSTGGEQVPASSPPSSENGGILDAIQASLLSVSKESLATAAGAIQQTKPNEASVPPVTDSDILQLTPPTVTPVSQPTTGITRRSASSPSSEVPNTNAEHESQTHATAAQTSPGTPSPNILQNTVSSLPEQSQSKSISVGQHSDVPQASLPQLSLASKLQQSNTATAAQQTSPATNSQSNAISATEHSNTPLVPLPQLSSAGNLLESNINTASQQASSVTNTPVLAQSSGSQDHSANTEKLTIPPVVNTGNTNKLPFTQPGQSGSNTETSSPKSENAFPGVTSSIPAVIPTSAAGIHLPSGEQTKSNLPSVADHTANAPTSASIELPLSGPIALPTASRLVPPVSISGSASLDIALGASRTNEAQPASSPALPESASIHPTVSGIQPLITPAGELNPSTVKSALDSGVGLPVSQLSSAVPLGNLNSEASLPTATELDSALTNALQTPVSPGSSMLPDVSVIATSQLSGVVNTLSGPSGLANGLPSILQAPSITLSSGNVFQNPLTSSPIAQQTSIPLVTLSDGSVVSNPLKSFSEGTILPEGSGSIAVSLPSGTVVSVPLVAPTISLGPSVFTSDGIIISSPLATNAPITPGGIVLTNSAGSETAAVPVIPASITRADGSVIQNPSATILPSGVLLPSDQSNVGTQTFAGISPINSAASALSGLPESLTAAPNTVQGSGSAPQASSTDSNGVVVPIPVQTSGAVNTAVIDTGLSQSGVPVTSEAVIPGSVQPTQSLNSAGVESGSATIPSEALSSGNLASQVSGTVPTGVSLPVVVGSTTDTSGNAVPITAGQTIGSSTLSGGAVVPVTASNPSASPTSGLPVSSGAGSGSQTIPSGANVPSASGSGLSNTASGSEGTGTGQKAAGQSEASQTATGQTGVSQTGTIQSGVSQILGSQSEEGQSTGASGIVATGASQSPSQPAPSPVTGTATAQPNSAATSPAVLPVATTSQDFPSDAKGPFTQQPTSYDTNTIQSVPTSILAQPSSTTVPQSSFSGPTGLPTGVPLVLYPPDGVASRPDNTELIQVGFLYPLNYDFVWTHGESQQQIFKYLPMGIAWGLQIDIENVTMQSLRAWDTTQDLHYITTLALAWVPSGQVQSLGLLVHTPTSRFYHTPDNSTNTLLSMINIALPIVADNSTDGGDSTGFGAEPSSTSTMKDGGAPVGGGIGSSNPVRASSVGIACGVAAGAAAYGAAMFLVARRYRKRRQSHLRSPSMFNSPVMSHAGPDALAGAALMSGGVGDHRSPSPYHDEDIRAASRGSGRSASTGRQQISAPVMAENSLGWN
ncbi:multicopy suppressor of a budding defect [Lecanora helva]